LNYPLDFILLPMGGNTVKDEDKMEALWDDDNYVAEEKYDGSRYVSVGGRFFSRKVSVKTDFPVEKTENVPHLSFLTKYPKLILDGEVYFEGMNSNDVTKIMGAKPEKAIARQEDGGYLNYVAFDILRDFDGNWLMDKPWKERRIILERVVGQIKLDLLHDRNINYDKIDVSQVVVYDKRDFYKEIMERNGEGVMLKNVNATYYPDKKPAWNWVKVKKHITADVVIMGFKPPKKEYSGEDFDTHPYWEDSTGVFMASGLDEARNISHARGSVVQPVSKFYYYGWIGAVTFGQFDMNNVVTICDRFGENCKEYPQLKELGYCSGITEELREDITANPDKYIEQVMEIGAMEVTKDGFFRHPQFSRFRDDKNARDCVVGVL
jgi:ATP-dependent DNA ligase